ncbi:MAG: shikimate kinase [Lentihominibacter sp.]|jgi:shikimate kinase
MIFVTGYFGAPVREKAEELASEQGLEVINLDKMIEAADGRSIKRICMMHGEHGYRNKEYEALKELTEGSAASDGKAVVLCGDGVLHDDMSREILMTKGTLVIVGENMSPEELWERAKQIDDTYHAFMFFGSESDKRKAFEGLHCRQKVLFGGLHDSE